MDIIKISSESDKHIKVNESYQNKNLRYSSKTIKVNENKTPKSKNSLTLKDFIIVTRKGKGRFGEVYLALHCKTGTLVALKLQKKSQLRKNNMIERFIF